ncbi:MAG TPA: DUF1361 domain-containing protein [Puia sp.]|nr:DUF1361 domain-containing protein [Puia sp.]
MNTAQGPAPGATHLSMNPVIFGSRKLRPGIFRTEMGRLLFLSMVFSCILLLVRIVHTGRITFIFLTWNLFLAFLPWVISDYLSRMGCLFREKCLPRTKYLFGELDASDTATAAAHAHLPGPLNGPAKGPAFAAGSALRNRSRFSRKALFVTGSLTWLLFIPNSFYILTDLFHLKDWYNDGLMPNWFDLVMILSFAWNGLLLGILSLRQMEKIFLPLLPAHNELFFVYPVMWLNALGVFIGRYLRFNTWDVITDPFQLFGDIAGIVLHPVRNHYAWDMIFCFSVLMTLIYLMLKKIGKALV